MGAIVRVSLEVQKVEKSADKKLKAKR